MKNAFGAASPPKPQLTDDQLARLLRELADAASDTGHDLGTALYYFSDELRRADLPELTDDTRIQIIQAVRECLPGSASEDWRANLRAVNGEVKARRARLGPVPGEAILRRMVRDAAERIETQMTAERTCASTSELGAEGELGPDMSGSSRQGSTR